MPAAPELQALLNHRLKKIENKDRAMPTLAVDLRSCGQGVPLLRGCTPVRSRYHSAEPDTPGSAKSGDAAAGGPMPVTKADSSPALLVRPSGAPQNNEVASQQWKRACVWSSRARMCSALSKNGKNENRLRANTEPDSLHQLHSELLQRVRSANHTPRFSDLDSQESPFCQESAAWEASSRLEALARQHDCALEELSARLAAESLKSENLATKLEDLQHSRQADAVWSCEWVERFREDYKEVRERNKDLAERNQLLAESNMQLKKEMLVLQRSGAAKTVPRQELKSEAKPETTPEPEVKTDTEEEAGSPTSISTGCTGSEGRLRAALTGRKVPTEELRHAIASVEALLAQAKRELAARELRERRAAYEQLHSAVEGEEEEPLRIAIEVAILQGVDEEDVAKAQNKLQELRSLSDEQRAAQAAAKRLTDAKRRAFQLAKRGEALALKELLASWDEGEGSMCWRNWKDHAGRSLVAYAKEVQSVTVKECLERMLAPTPSSQPEIPALVFSRVEETSSSVPELVSPRVEKKLPKPPVSPPPSTPVRQRRRSPASVEHEAAIAVGGGGGHLMVPLEDRFMPRDDVANFVRLTPRIADTATSSSPAPSEEMDEETAELKSAAFKAVVKDNTAALRLVLDRLPREVWSRWHNKAGRDLLTLSQERRAPGCYIMLARAMGLVLERKREAFEESETVWILSPGEVQPRHATVLEDTPGDSEDVLVEFWDAEGPPERVEHCLVLKAN